MNVLTWASKLVLTIVLLLLAAAFVIAPASAQALQCGPIDQVVEHLTERYEEQLVGDGLGPNGTRLLVFVHPEGNTWTVLGLMPDGQACFIASGTDWRIHDFTPAGSET